MGRPITKSSSIWLKTVHAPDSQTDQKWFHALSLSAARGIRSPFCAMIAIPTARPANAKRRTGASMAEPNLCTFSIMRLYALSGCRVSGRRGWRSLPACCSCIRTPYLYTPKWKCMRAAPHNLRALNAECVLDKNNNARSYLPTHTKNRSFERVFQNLKHLPALVKNTCCR